MVKERVSFDASRFNKLKEDIDAYEELIKDVTNVFSSVMNLGIHSEMSINRLIKHMNEDCTQKTYENRSLEKKYVYGSRNNENMNSKKDTDLIRFTNNGPLFQISKQVIDSLYGSYIYEQSAKELRTNDGNIYLGYDGNDGFVYSFLDYLNGKYISFHDYSYEDQLEFLNLFEFCNLSIPLELVDCRERRDRPNKIKYKDDDKVLLYVNNKQDSILSDYLKECNKWTNYVMNYDNGFVNYNHITNQNGTINIEADKINDIHKELLENEMYDLFGYKGKKQVKEVMSDGYFKNSSIVNKELEIPLVNWLGKEKKWKLLFRASEHNYLAHQFHKYCDKKGETVVLIKHIGKNDHINIFGGYTDQDWESSGNSKSYSNEFLFTLSNEHGVPPTKYDHTGSGYGILCSSSSGPQFGYNKDIYISDNCHYTANSYCEADSYAEANIPQNGGIFTNTPEKGPSNPNNRGNRYTFDEKDIHHRNFTIEEYEVWGKV
ncbi:hypothetical protein WA158_007840 [Blastocystis sp. Blastoise]